MAPKHCRSTNAPQQLWNDMKVALGNAVELALTEPMMDMAA
jgi:hypothetical protein